MSTARSTSRELMMKTFSLSPTKKITVSCFKGLKSPSTDIPREREEEKGEGQSHTQRAGIFMEGRYLMQTHYWRSFVTLHVKPSLSFPPPQRQRHRLNFRPPIKNELELWRIGRKESVLNSTKMSFLHSISSSH